MEEDLKEGEVGGEKEETDNRVEQEDFSGFSQQLLHVDPAPLGLREPPWHLGHDGSVEGVSNREKEGAGCLPDAWQGSSSPQKLLHFEVLNIQMYPDTSMAGIG